MRYKIPFFVITILVIASIGAVRWLHSEDALVDDQAGLFTAEQSGKLVRHHRYLLQDHDIDYRVLTVNDVTDINRFANERYRALGVGSLSNSGRGLLLVVAAAQDRVRLEVSMGLEGIFVDAFVGYLEREQMVPFFRAGRVADGILAATEMLVMRVDNATAGIGYESEPWHADSAGAGAASVAHLGAGYLRPGEEGADVAAGESPEQTVRAYIRAMADHNMRPELSLYTEDTRRMLAGWVTTTAQADNLVRIYRDCIPEPARMDALQHYAVIRYRVEQRQCAPWFLQYEQGQWRLDLTMMQKAIRFGRSNAWHFDLNTDHPYRYAFSDWRFDHNGYPYPLGK